MQVEQLFFVVNKSIIVSTYEEPLTEEWLNKILSENQFVNFTHDLLFYLSDSLKWINFSIDDVNVVYQGLNYEGMNTLYPNQIHEFKNLINAWYKLFENANDNFTLKIYASEKMFEKSKVLQHLNQLIKLCEIIENNPEKCLVHCGFEIGNYND